MARANSNKFFGADEISREKLEEINAPLRTPEFKARVKVIRDKYREKYMAERRNGRHRARSKEMRDAEKGEIDRLVRSVVPNLPNGYNVSPVDAVVQYTNETPALQKLAWAALPFVVASGVGAIAGAAGWTGGAAAAPAVASTLTPSVIPAATTAAAIAPAATTGATGAAAGATGATGAITGVTAAAGGGKTVMDGIKAAMSGRDWADLAMFGAGRTLDYYNARSADRNADKAGAREEKAAADALALLREQWEQSRKDYAPWLKMGTTATNKINAGLEGMKPAGPMPASIQSGISGAPSMSSYGVGASDVNPQTLAQGRLSSYAPAAPGARPGPQQQAPGAKPRLVTMRYGDMQKSVTIDQVPMWRSRGAEVVGMENFPSASQGVA